MVETVLAAQAANQTSTAGNAELQTLKAQMLLIEARLPNHNAGRLGGNLFQSRADVCLFVEKHVPSNAFHLFHDVVTFKAMSTSLNSLTLFKVFTHSIFNYSPGLQLTNYLINLCVSQICLLLIYWL